VDPKNDSPTNISFTEGVTETVAPVNTTTAGPVTITTTAPARYTEDDLARVRKQEKDKLYDQIEDMRTSLQTLREERQAERDAADAAARRLQEEAEAAARARTESETDVRTLLSQKEQEWAARLEAERAEREKAFALLEQERRYSELESYRQQAIAAAQDDIVPELLDLAGGNTPEEIDQSIAGLRERSARILENVSAAAQAQRQQMQGARVTAPASGPLDNTSDNQSYTAESLAKMSFSDYVKNRSKILGQARDGGLFG
jgi:hypothetical protein